MNDHHQTVSERLVIMQMNQTLNMIWLFFLSSSIHSLIPHSLLWKMDESEWKERKVERKNKTSITLSLVLSEFFLERIIFQVMISTTAFWKRKIFLLKECWFASFIIVRLHLSLPSLISFWFSFLLFSLFEVLFRFFLFLSSFQLSMKTNDSSSSPLFPGYWSWRKIPLIEKKEKSWETKG